MSMECSYVYDQDPRYGWVSISMCGNSEGLIVVQDKDGMFHGFTFEGGEMTPTCICSARHEYECACPNAQW